MWFNSIITEVFVDDLIILSNDIAAKTNIKNQLMLELKIKAIGEARLLNGMQIARGRKNKKL